MKNLGFIFLLFPMLSSCNNTRYLTLEEVKEFVSKFPSEASIPKSGTISFVNNNFPYFNNIINELCGDIVDVNSTSHAVISSSALDKYVYNLDNHIAGYLYRACIAINSNYLDELINKIEVEDSHTYSVTNGELTIIYLTSLVHSKHIYNSRGGQTHYSLEEKSNDSSYIVDTIFAY